MCFTIDQIERACGLLLLNEFNTFIYCCKNCSCEFESGSHLEVHILSEHQDDKGAVFMNDEIFVDDFVSTTIECEPTAVKLEPFGGNFEVFDELNIKKPKQSTEESSEEDTPLANLLGNDDSENDESTKVEKKNHPRPDESTESKNEATITKKRRGRPIGWKKRSDGDEKFALGTKKVRSNRPRGRPPGAKNINYCEDGIMKSFAKADETSTKKTGRPTTGTFYCDMCPDLKFDGKMNLTKHIHYCHVLKKRKCEICNKIPRKGYDHHMKKFHTVQLHKCDICDAAFKVPISLVVHMRNHRGEKPYLCESCGKSFSSQALYKKHETMIHSDIRKYQCQQCDRSFHRRYRLRDHINAFHTGEKPHKCDICGKGFASTSYLRVHKMTHGDKVLPCRYCDKMFKLSENRHKHEVSIHKVMKTNTTGY